MKKQLIGLVSALSLMACSVATAQETVQAPIVNKVQSYTWQNELVGYDTVCKEIIVNQPKGTWTDGPSGVLQGDGNSLLGGIIGGVIGDKVGNGKVGATALGVIIGSNIGNGTSKKHGGQIRRTVCDEVPMYERVKSVNGYKVTYMYNGRHYSAFFNEDPGTHVTLNLHTTHSVRNK